MTKIELPSDITIYVAGVGLVPLWHPKPHHIMPKAIARGLAREGRYGNQSLRHYSVAEHSWLVSKLCPDNPLQGLVHDAHEAIIGDLLGPIKRLLRAVEGSTPSTYDKLEARWWEAVAEQFGVSVEIDRRVERIDKALRVVEQNALFGLHTGMDDWLGNQSKALGLKRPLKIRCLNPVQAERLWWARLVELGPVL